MYAINRIPDCPIVACEMHGASPETVRTATASRKDCM